MAPRPAHRTARTARTTRTVRTALPALLAALVLAALPLGCAPGTEQDGTTAEALTADARTAFDYFIGKGLTPVQAAGIVGNLVQESGVSPTAVQPGGPGRGIAQWSVGGRWDHDAGDNLVAFATSAGGSRWALSVQLDFVWYELTHFSGYGLAQLRAATTVSAAVIAFERRFEGCGTCEEARRIAYANDALSMFGADAVASWGGRFVSQSFPYASAGSVSITAGGTARISLTMQNSGSHAWDSRTCIGTTTPRDRHSVFAGSEWPGPNRPACVPAGTTVARGANHTFTWTMHAPAAAGRYDERWGMVEEGVTWFSAAGEGGPADDQLEGIFTVTAAPPATTDAGTVAHDAGTVAHDAGTDARSGDGGASGGDGGVVGGDDGGASANDAGASEHDGGAREAGGGSRSDASDDGGNGGSVAGGCSAGPASNHRGSPWRAVTALLFAASLAIGARRRRRS